MKKQSIIFWAILFLFQGIYAQTDYYVSKTLGEDTNPQYDGKSPSKPFKTITKALETFDASGGVCYVMEGT